MKSIINQVSGASTLNDKTSPQWLAFQWLDEQDSLTVCPDNGNVAQRYGLALFYFATNGDEWLTCTRDGSKSCGGEPFLSGVHECKWGGITCGLANRVLNINLGSNNLQGVIPNEIKVFQNLTEFDADENSLVGTIPSSFGQLPNMNFLDLDSNSLVGPIPEELYDLTSLISLDLDSNMLSGTISTKIGQLTNLFIVQFDLNQLTGRIPTETGLLTNLGYFTATGNSFSGLIPNELCGTPSEALVADCGICPLNGCCTNCTDPETR